jgi:polysaccharide export outer membrane protein
MRSTREISGAVTAFALMGLWTLSLTSATPLHGQQEVPSPSQAGAAPKPEGVKEGDRAPAGPATAAPVDPNKYKIGAEDVLKITVWREAELSGQVAVRPDGMVTIPLVGEVQVAGLTPIELTDRLKSEFAKLVNNPVVSVEVWLVRSRKYYIAGMVPRPGQYSLVVPVTVLEALTLAGGPTEWANKKKITIMRGAQRLKFNWNDVIKGKNLGQNVYLEPGDFINVP